MPGDTEQLAVVEAPGSGTAAAGSGAVEASKAHASSQPTTQSSAQVTKRLQSELMALMTSAQNDGVSAFPDGDNIFIWIGTIVGGAGTVYENLSYKLSLKFPVDYPFQPPTVKFETPCFHPNVDQYGNICLDILREKWSASYTVRTILLSIQSLLGEPNNESPLNGYAAHLWSNEEEYLKVLTKKYQEAVGTNK